MTYVPKHDLQDGDLGEMLVFAYTYRELGAAKIQMDTEYAIEILERLIEHEKAVA